MFERFDKSELCGIIATVVFHLVLSLVCVSSGLRYIYPPPQERVLISFEEEPEPPRQIKMEASVEPRTPKPSPDKAVNLVRQSESPVKGNSQARSAEATTGERGDVEVSEPRKKEIDQRALFSSARTDNTDSVSQTVSSRPSQALSGGHPEGNTMSGNADGSPSAQLKGRTVVGSLPMPVYSIQEGGRVVVSIVVDGSGQVVSAQAGAKGTTVVNHTLWREAEKAARQARFSASGTSRQEGTITYNFQLR